MKRESYRSVNEIPRSVNGNSGRIRSILRSLFYVSLSQFIPFRSFCHSSFFHSYSTYKPFLFSPWDQWIYDNDSAM